MQLVVRMLTMHSIPKQYPDSEPIVFALSHENASTKLTFTELIRQEIEPYVYCTDERARYQIHHRRDLHQTTNTFFFIKVLSYQIISKYEGNLRQSVY